MPDQKLDVEAVRRVVEKYVNGSFTGDAAMLSSVFHPDAIMTGYLLGDLLLGSPEPFIQRVGDSPSHRDTGKPYEGTIESIEVAGDVATAKLVEKSLFDLDFVNYFQLVREDEEWRIVAKIFHHD